MEGEKKKNIKTELVGYLVGHKDLVTSIVVGNTTSSSNDAEFLVSSSRDKTLLLWDLKDERENKVAGVPKKMLTGHNHFITDLALTPNNVHLFSSSWDNSARLWDLQSCKTQTRFVGNQKEVNSVCFSNDGRLIYTAGMDKKIYLWNINGEMKHSTSNNNHTDWISKIRSSPSAKNEFFASAGWDGKLKIWSPQLSFMSNYKCHNGPILGLDISQNGQMIVTGGKDNLVILHSVVNLGKNDREFKMDSSVKDVLFNPVFLWLGICCEDKLFVYELSSGSKKPLCVIEPMTGEHNNKGKPKFNTFVWSNSGKKVYVGCDNGDIATYDIEVNEE